jgi:D-inositol-3-phosphate glycosyltransferase
VIVLNPVVEQQIRALAPQADVRIVPNGVDTDRFSPPDGDEKDALRRRLGWDGRLRALFVGRLVQKKGIDVVLAAAARTPEVQWVLAGPGTPPRTPPSNVDVLGPVEPGAMHELYRAADLLVLPSHGEGFPLSIQEAMASGLPVVAADDPVYRSGDGPPAGLILAPADAEHVTSAVHRLAADPSARAALGAEARGAVLERYSWGRSADAHEQLYLAATGRA